MLQVLGFCLATAQRSEIFESPISSMEERSFRVKEVLVVRVVYKAGKDLCRRIGTRQLQPGLCLIQFENIDFYSCQGSER